MKQYLDKNGLADYSQLLANKLKTIFALKGEPASDEQVATQVAAYLDAHPELVTTVEDGAITKAKFNDSAFITLLAPAYDSTKTYDVHDYVMYEGDLYVCVTKIGTAEAWTAAHWASATLGAGIATAWEAIDIIERLLRGRGISAAELQAIAQSGHADEFFAPGDIIYIPWTDNVPGSPVLYSVPVIIAGFKTAEDDQGNTYPNSPILMWMYSTPNTLPFDAPEIVACAAGTEIEDGYYYYTKDGDNYVALDPQPSAGSTVPAGSTYYKHDLPSAGGAIRYGLNDWKWSAYRQWLNSEAAKNAGWWTSQHPCDVAPDSSYRNMPGFLDGFSAEWKAIFKPVKVLTCRNTVTFNGATETTYDIFFLPSVVEMYGSGDSTQNSTEGPSWPYWKDATGLSSPSNGSSSNTNNARKIPTISNPSGSSVILWLRSAYRSNGGLTWIVGSAGYLGNGGSAGAAYRCLPACVIY